MSISDKFRTWDQMETEDDFIQYLERLVSGTPSESAASTASARAAGINRPLSRLAHNTDALLDALVATQTRVLLADNADEDEAYIDFTGGVLTFYKQWKILSMAPIEDNVGLSIADGTSVTMGGDNVVYAVLDRSAGDTTVAITPQKSAGFSTLRDTMKAAEDTESYLDYILIGYTTGGSGDKKTFRMFNGQTIPDGERISGLGLNTSYAPAVMGRQNGAILSGGGTRSWNSGTGAVSWSSDLDLNIPSCPKLTVTDPSGLSLQPGEILTATITGRSQKALSATTQTAPAVVRDPSATSFLNSALEHDGNDYVIIAVCGGTSGNRTLHWLDGVVQTELLTSFKSGDVAGWGTTVVSVTAGDSAKAEGAALTNVHRQGNIEIEGEGVTVSSEGADGKIKVTNDYYWQDRNISFSAPHTPDGKFFVGLPGEGGVPAGKVEITGKNWIYVNVPGLTSATNIIVIDLDGSAALQLAEGELAYFTLDRDMSSSVQFVGSGTSPLNPLTVTSIDSFNNSTAAKDAVVVAYRHLQGSSDTALDDLYAPVFLCGTAIEPGSNAYIGQEVSLLDISGARTYQYSHRGSMECEIVSGSTDAIKLSILGSPIVISRPGRVGHITVPVGVLYTESVGTFTSASIGLPAVPGYAVIGVTWEDGGRTLSTDEGFRNNFKVTSDADRTHVDDYFIPIAKLYWSSSSDYHFVLWNGAMIGEGGNIPSKTFNNETFWHYGGLSVDEAAAITGAASPSASNKFVTETELSSATATVISESDLDTHGTGSTDGGAKVLTSKLNVALGPYVPFLNFGKIEKSGSFNPKPIYQVLNGFDHIYTDSQGSGGSKGADMIYISGGMVIFDDTFISHVDGTYINTTVTGHWLGSSGNSSLINNTHRANHCLELRESVWYGEESGYKTGIWHPSPPSVGLGTGATIGGHYWGINSTDGAEPYNVIWGRNYIYIRPHEDYVVDTGSGKLCSRVKARISKWPPLFSSSGGGYGQGTRTFDTTLHSDGYGDDEGTWLCIGSVYLHANATETQWKLASSFVGAGGDDDNTGAYTQYGGFSPTANTFDKDWVRAIPFSKIGKHVKFEQPLAIHYRPSPDMAVAFDDGVQCAHPSWDGDTVSPTAGASPAAFTGGYNRAKGHFPNTGVDIGGDLDGYDTNSVATALGANLNLEPLLPELPIGSVDFHISWALKTIVDSDPKTPCMLAVKLGAVGRIKEHGSSQSMPTEWTDIKSKYFRSWYMDNGRHDHASSGAYSSNQLSPHFQADFTIPGIENRRAVLFRTEQDGAVAKIFADESAFDVDGGTTGYSINEHTGFFITGYTESLTTQTIEDKIAFNCDINENYFEEDDGVATIQKKHSTWKSNGSSDEDTT